MYMFAPTPRYSRRNDWGAVLAQAQQQAQTNAAVDAAVEALAQEVLRFVDVTRANREALQAKINEMRPQAQAADSGFDDVEAAVWGEDNVPPELTEIVDNMPSGFDNFLDEVEAKLDEVSV